MIPDIVEIKRLCASGQWIAKVEEGKILLHDTVAGETVCIGKVDAVPVVRCKERVHAMVFRSGQVSCGYHDWCRIQVKPDGYCYHGEMDGGAEDDDQGT